METERLWGKSLISLLILIFLSTLSMCDSGFVVHRECAVLTSGGGGGITPQSFTLDENFLSPDLREEYRASPSGWNTSTNSFVVRDGCTLTLCDGPYLSGACQSRGSGSYSSSSSLTLSARCTCKPIGRACGCSNVRMKWSECARAYFDGGCDTCDSPYTRFKGESGDVGQEFSSAITAFRLRDGCTLKIYDEPDFEGDEVTITNQTFSNFDGIVSSQKCTCEPRSPPPSTALPPNPAYPKAVQVPLLLDQLNAMLNSGNEEHPGLLAALRSLTSNPGRRRSPRNAYILILGSSGAGKSSLVRYDELLRCDQINMLLDQEGLSTVGASASTTTGIHEFRIPMPVPELGVTNSELVLIDTPGFGDTRGLEHDARLLATLDSYLSYHDELHDRVPNAVLILHRLNDNRFDGVGSPFVQMLEAVATCKSRLFDTRFSNVMFVLTHLTAESKETQRNPGQKLAEFKQVIESSGRFPSPIITTVFEDRPEERSLRRMNNNVEFPNKEYFPQNIFQRLEAITKNTRDDMGTAIFQTWKSHQGPLTIVRKDFNAVDSGSSVSKYLALLSNRMLDANSTMTPGGEARVEVASASPVDARNQLEENNSANMNIMTKELVNLLQDINSQLQASLLDATKRLEESNRSHLKCSADSRKQRQECEESKSALNGKLMQQTIEAARQLAELQRKCETETNNFLVTIGEVEMECQNEAATSRNKLQQDIQDLYQKIGGLPKRFRRRFGLNY